MASLPADTATFDSEIPGGTMAPKLGIFTASGGGAACWTRLQKKFTRLKLVGKFTRLEEVKSKFQRSFLN